LNSFCFRQQDSNANVVYTTTDKTNNDILLKQLLKNITVPQQLNGKQ